jgi:hypothetical protein
VDYLGLFGREPPPKLPAIAAEMLRLCARMMQAGYWQRPCHHDVPLGAVPSGRNKIACVFGIDFA